MNDVPRKRWWFRFSLRTLLVLMTLVGCWLGWQTGIVRERRALREKLSKGLAFHFVSVDDHLKTLGPNLPVDPPVAQVPRVRELLGDEAVQTVYYYEWHQDFSPATLKEVERLFPEAKALEVLPEPCHPGCFPWGTMIETASGPAAIESISVGTELIVYLGDGTRSTARVSSIFHTRNYLLRLRTDDGKLVTTEQQPLCRSVDRVIAAGQLRSGDQIVRVRAGELKSVGVSEVTKTNNVEPVINLVLSNSELFIANGYLARSKPPE